MYGYDNMLTSLNREKRRIEDMIQNYQNQPQAINNFITNQTPPKDHVEWRVLNENEEVDNLYVATKTLFINDNTMILKDVDGKTEKWEVKKIYPIDKKDEKINALEEEIRKLKEVINNEHKQSNEPIGEIKQSNVNAYGNVESKPKTNGKPITK